MRFLSGGMPQQIWRIPPGAYPRRAVSSLFLVGARGHMAQQLSCSLHRENARAVLRRLVEPLPIDRPGSPYRIRVLDFLGIPRSVCHFLLKPYFQGSCPRQTGKRDFAKSEDEHKHQGDSPICHNGTNKNIHGIIGKTQKTPVNNRLAPPRRRRLQGTQL